MANHGVVALGIDLDAAAELAEKVEALARLYWQALQVGEPVLLDDAEMARVVEKFRDYGKPGSTASYGARVGFVEGSQTSEAVEAESLMFVLGLPPSRR